MSAENEVPHPPGPAVVPEDPYAWLEDVEGERALAWVGEQNRRAEGALAAGEEFATLERRILEVLDSDDRIPAVGKIGDRYYNFWRDAAHPRGLWRRTTLESYRTARPAWEPVLDLDALADAEGASWVWHGARVLREPDGTRRRALVSLSPGGSDADVTREFDLVTREFVADGFVRPEAKGGLSWIDRDTVFVFTDLGPGTTTTSGYPRTVRRWRRGQALADAELVYEGAEDDLAVGASHDPTPGFERDFVSRQIDFYTSELFWLDGDRRVLIDVPRSAEAGVRREWLLVELREDWTVEIGGASRTHPAGALLAIGFDAFLAGDRRFTELFTPTPTTSLAGATWTDTRLVLTVLSDVVASVLVLTPPAAGPWDAGDAGDAESATAPRPWSSRPLTGLPELGSVDVRAVDSLESDEVWVTMTGYLTPSTLALADVGGAGDARAAALDPVKAAPSFFDADGLRVEQHLVTSDDGTRVPYFLVRPASDAWREGAPLPTLLYAYGGFEVSLTPGYSGVLGRAWLERGGAYAVANIRGGGEYGPRWHQAALRENRHRAYEDLAAVARDLVARGVTTPSRLGVRGGSNGGLLAGNMYTGYPDLFGAVVAQVPLLDMRRYSHLLAGASWMAEYGDPDDPQQWEFLRTFSPYHRVDAGREYPPLLLTTSTRDDRVHPGHARKMAALLLAAGKDVTYYENVEGGHGGAATNAQAARMEALAYRFLRQQLS